MTVCVGEEVPCVFWMHVRMRVNVFVFNYKNKDCFIVYIKIDALALSIFFLKLFSVRYQTYQICFHFLWHIRLICPDFFLFLFPYIAQTYSTEIKYREVICPSKSYYYGSIIDDFFKIVCVNEMVFLHLWKGDIFVQIEKTFQIHTSVLIGYFLRPRDVLNYFSSNHNEKNITFGSGLHVVQSKNKSKKSLEFLSENNNSLWNED